MNSLIWDRSLSVSEEEIDAQHKVIFDIINKLIKLKNLEPHSEIICETLTKLREYSEFHFKLEESYMKKTGYIDLASHKLLHNDYKIRIANFSLSVMARHSSVSDDLIEFLNEWWLSHILTIDIQYAIAVQGNKQR